MEISQVDFKEIGTSIETLKGFGKRLDRQERQALMVTVSAPIDGPELGRLPSGGGHQAPAGLLETPWERLADVWDEATLRLEYLIDERSIPKTDRSGVNNSEPQGSVSTTQSRTRAR
jgi:hypothetical protein